MKSSDMVEALEINAAIDTMITDRQAIADRQKHYVDVLQETWDLVRLGHQYKEAGKDWYRWAKATAIRLWESTQSRAEEMKDNGVSL
ncbi:TPA: hypothetical protein ACU8CQ_004645 [Escherichia coli]|uniref:hypothetical protein n=1 Tax=Escherichia coli TaxID=562 RepID=UPI000A2E4611|nr:hypothetical protein [Escherichia coli]EFI0096856.1 hypothetical protein [Escherichia coli]EFI0867569.1 hypothetical protein [Escherichia coli]EFL5840780.1 hypothetical protein [Escherichia coli]EGD1913350.1 hypothetical protein [Escherichia coli]EGO4663002.1 hypothetical protein [Escherichia coli]